MKTVKGVSGLTAALTKDLAALDKRVGRAALKACKDGVGIVKAKLPKRDHVKRGIEAEATETGAKIVSTAPYSGYVEEGARPHLVPFEVLLEWATERGFQDPGAVAKSVQKKIAARGVAPTWFMRSSIPEIRDRFDTILKGESGGEQ